MAKHRVCIIGNSHVAALRTGLDKAPKLAEKMSPVFFAAQSDMMREMVLQGTKLVPTSELTKRRMSIVSGGTTVIELTDYTEFMVVGLGFNMLDAVNALRQYRLYGFHCESDDAIPFLSKVCFDALIESRLRASTAVYLAKLLRCASHARIVIIPQPFPSADILKGGIWKQIAENGLLTHVAKSYEHVAKRLANDLHCEILFQPLCTLMQDGITHVKYSVDSIRLGVDMSTKHSSGETFHMNALYGEEVLKAYCDPLR